MWKDSISCIVDMGEISFKVMACDVTINLKRVIIPAERVDINLRWLIFPRISRLRNRVGRLQCTKFAYSL